MINVTQRIPIQEVKGPGISMWSYIEFEGEYDSPELAIAANKKMVSETNAPGLPEKEWAQVRNKMFETGQFDPNIEGLNNAQRYFINQCKLAIRAVNKSTEPTIN